jgi:hypothetical protein
VLSLPLEQIRPGEVPDQEGGILLEETRDYPCWIRQRVVMNPQERIQKRIAFLKEQLDSLDHYLPETYQFLMAELDLQQRELMEHKIQDFYWNQTNEQQDPITDSGDQTQSQESDHRNQ